MARKNLEQLLAETAEHGRHAAQLADRRLCLSGGAERVHQLARRAAGLARDRGAVRPVAPHGRADDRGAGRARRCCRISAINSFANFPVNRAKQFVPCSHDGHVIGDVILFHLAENQFLIVGRVPTINWVEFHGKTGGYDVQPGARRPLALAAGPQGGGAQALPLPDPGAERAEAAREAERRPAAGRQVLHTWTTINIGGRKVRALRHGMSGAPGLEIWGPYEEGEEIRDIIFEAGKEFGLRLVGARAYATNTLESGWIPSPLPAVYTGDEDEALPRVAAGRRLRGRRLDRRQLRIRRTSRTIT